MAVLDLLVDAVAIHVSPCPESAILDATSHIVRDFCKESRIWIHDCEKKQLTEDDQSMLLTKPVNSTIVHVWGINGRCGVYAEDSLEYYLSPPDQLQFNQHERMTGKLIQPLVSLMPSISSKECPDFIMEYFSEGLVSGAVAYLQMQPYRAWSQPNAAAPHHENYLNAIKQAKFMRDNGLGLSKTKSRVKPRYL